MSPVIQPNEEVLLIKPIGTRFGADTAVNFKNHVQDLLAQGPRRAVVLDMSQIEFMDSSGLGALVSLLKQIGNRSDLAVAGLQDAVRNLFKLTRMDKVFRIYPTPDDAVAALSK